LLGSACQLPSTITGKERYKDKSMACVNILHLVFS